MLFSSHTWPCKASRILNKTLNDLSSNLGLQRPEVDNGVYVNASHSWILVVVVVCFGQCHEVTLCRDGIAGGHNFTFFGSRVLTWLDAKSVLFVFVLSLTFILSFYFFLMLFSMLSLSLTFVWAGFSRSGSIGNPLNPAPESARWRSG